MAAALFVEFTLIAYPSDPSMDAERTPIPGIRPFPTTPAVFAPEAFATAHWNGQLKTMLVLPWANTSTRSEALVICSEAGSMTLWRWRSSTILVSPSTPASELSCGFHWAS